MFGLRAFFAALSRLTASINRSADLFDAANVHLAEQLGFDHAEPPALEHHAQSEESPANGKARKRVAAK
jgi:hypothetical protein